MIKCGDSFRFRPTYSELYRRSPRLSFFSSVCQTVARPVRPSSGGKPEVAQPSNLKISHKGWCAPRTAPPNTQLPPAQQFANIKKGFLMHTSRGDVYTHLFVEITAVAENVQFSQNQCYLPHTHGAKCYSLVSPSSQLVDI